MAVKINPKSLVAVVNKEIGKATPAAYLKTLGKSVVSNKLKAMVAAGIHCGNEITKPKVAKILGTLESFDIRSERMAEYYIKGGFVAIKSQMTEQEIAKIGLSNIMKWSTKLLSDEATGSAKIVQAKIVELQAEAQKRKDAKDAKADADKAARKQATQTTAELLEEEYDESDGLTDTRVYAHLTVYFASIQNQVVRVLSDNASTAMSRLSAMITKEFNRLEKADKEAAEKKAKAAK